MASFCGSYFLSRIFSAIAVVSFPCAKKEGTLYMFAHAAQEKIVKRSLYAELALCALWQILMDPKAGIMQLICALTVFGYYYYKSKKEFGGITGDLAGYFVTLCEGALMVMAAIAAIRKEIFMELYIGGFAQRKLEYVKCRYNENQKTEKLFVKVIDCADSHYKKCF